MSPRMVAAVLSAAVSLSPAFVAKASAQSEVRQTPIVDTLASTTTTQFAAPEQTVPVMQRELPNPGMSTSVLTALQVTTVATQILDVHSTMKAMNNGAVEANPMMRGVAKNPAAFIGVKAAMSAGLVYATHKMAKRNKVAAIVTSAAINSAYLVVAHHNYKVARSSR